MSSSSHKNEATQTQELDTQEPLVIGSADFSILNYRLEIYHKHYEELDTRLLF